MRAESPLDRIRLMGGAFLQGFRPPARLSVAEWADAHRIMGSASAPKGPWRTSLVPYTREPMDNFSSESPVEITVVRKAAQGAFSEVLLNVLAHTIAHAPADTILALPTSGTAKKFVRTRVDPMIEVCPALRESVVRPRSRDASNTTNLKDFHGGQLMIVGANSGADLRSQPAKKALCDEINGYPTDLDREGDPVDLIIQRTGAKRGRKIALISTPTLEEICAISRWYLKGDQRLYFIPCPLCDREQALVFGEDRVKDGRLGGLRWAKGSPDQARYQCEHCGDEFAEWQKIDALSSGQWCPQAPNVGGGKIRSYQINALYYPYGWPGSSWTNLAAEWETSHADPIRRKTFINLKMGLPYRDPSEAKADASELQARCESYGPELPRQVAVLTAGVDVQGNRLELELVGWGRDEESWSIDYRVFLGDTTVAVSANPDYLSPWEQLDGFLAGEWLSELGIPLKISAVCVDAGFQTATVAKWCGERIYRKVWATIGREGSKRPMWPRKPGRSKTKSPLFTLGVDSIKENVYARLRLPAPGPGYLHFTKGHNDAMYFDQLTSEIRVPDYTGPVPKFTWKKKAAGRRNEVLDCRGGSYAALCGLMAGSLRLNQEVANLERLAESRLKAVANPVPAVVQRASLRPIASSDPYL